METPKLTRQEFDKGIRLFVEVIKTQPGCFPPSLFGKEPGEFLAQQASKFVLALAQEKLRYCGDCAD